MTTPSREITLTGDAERMRRREMVRTDVAEPVSRRAILFALFGSPVAWTLHLLGSYLIVSVWCATRWNGMPVAVAVFTLACALTAAASGVVALRGWRRSQATLRSDREPGEPEGWDARMGERGARIVFLSVASLLMAILFTYLIVLQGLPPLVTPPCPVTTTP